MRTAMQELIEFGWENLDATPLAIVRKAEKLLEQEKQQIMDAVDEGSVITNYDTGMTHEFKYKNGEQYYDETFKP